MTKQLPKKKTLLTLVFMLLTFVVSMSAQTNLQLRAWETAEGNLYTNDNSEYFYQSTAVENYCEPWLFCSSAFMISNVSFEEIDNDSGCGEDGYSDFTDQEATVTAGETYTIAVTVGGVTDYADDAVSVWIDYDGSGSFDADEFTLVGVGSEETFSADITIPEEIEGGVYRMRVRVVAVIGTGGGGDPATWDMACDEGLDGETEDYSIVVTGEEVSCLEPTEIIVDEDEITDQSAEVTWTPGGDETQWEVIYNEAGFNPDTDGEVIVVDDIPETTLSDLEEDTPYDVYVRAVCEDENYSDWVGPVSFNTTLDVENHNFENFTFYPNPVKNQLTLKAGEQIESVTVYNLLGQKVIKSNPNTLQTQINMENLQAGIYLMRVTVNNMQKSFRVIKK
ncbi:MAG TPA: T9SS type A sorting domain-containing protein [Flavobacteriaceae bacterium]|nr:T9SS type A sorting domain-containing protein [Flavobacteriaceae bacterium]